MGRIEIRRNILEANEVLARKNREFFRTNGVLVVNIMAAPGAGKTSTILKTIEVLKDRYAFAVIEGDMASRIDADVMAERGIPVEQINTGNMCHLDANMIMQAAGRFTFDQPTILFVENVGNLVCPSEFSLGEDLNVVIAGTTEGHDKPYKYPSIYLRADAVLINKVDLLETMEFDRKMFRDGVAAIKPLPPLFEISCRTGTGLDGWTQWLSAECDRKFARSRGKVVGR